MVEKVVVLLVTEVRFTWHPGPTENKLHIFVTCVDQTPTQHKINLILLYTVEARVTLLGTRSAALPPHFPLLDHPTRLHPSTTHHY